MKTPSFITIIGSLLVLGLFAFPIWNIVLEAPQYPDGIGMKIYINGLQGREKHDLQNIDGLNHYIGMRTLPKPHEMWEFSVFPKVIGSMALLGVLLGVLGWFGKINGYWFLGWFVLMSTLGILGMVDFNAWMTDYGTNLDPKAIMKMMDAEGNPLTYKPPLFGSRDILNFKAHSYPSLGGYLLGLGMFLNLIAFWIWKKNKKS